MMKTRWKQFLPLAVLTAAALLAALGWWRTELSRRAAADRIAQLEAALARTSSNLQLPSAPSSNAEAVPSATSPGSSGKEHVASSRTRTNAASGESTPDAAVLEELRHRVQELARELATAREEVTRSEIKAAAEAAEVKTLQSQLAEVRDSSQQAKRSLEAVEAELRIRNERVARVEAAEKAATERATKAEAAAVKASGQSRELEDLIRRREGVATSLQRRYRDVTDLYRNFALNVQTRDTQSPGLQAGDLSRIQAAIQQAEDDLRQLQSLNLRVAQLARATATK